MVKIDPIFHVPCLNCGFQNALVFLESKYNGFRGFCPDCKGNWPES